MKPAIRTHAPEVLGVHTQTGWTSRSQTPSSDQTSLNDGHTKLERKYPAMANAIRLLWGYPEMNEYFSKLWLADGRAEPIDPEVMADLMLLARVHQDLVPVRPKATLSSIYGRAYGDSLAKQDIWGSGPRVR
jgi:hypothetical protein